MDDGARHSVEVRFLGCFSLTVNGSPIRQWRAGKARNLFQYLVLNKDQLVTRDQLYDALWPESEFPGGSSLKVAAHALRRVLQAHPDRPGDTGISIVYRDFGYSIHIEDFGSDVEEFQRLVSDGLRAHRAGTRSAPTGACGRHSGSTRVSSCPASRPRGWSSSASTSSRWPCAPSMWCGRPR